MANKDLFKQAIADAKSIREAAITNAKLALEESLTPQLKELLAQRLAEMEEEAETETVLAEAEVEETEHMEEGDYAKEEVAEAEEADEKEEEEGEEAGEEEVEDDSEESEDEAEEDLEVEDMTVEDLKDLIRDILSQEMGDEEPAGEEGDEEAEDMVGMDMTAEPEAESGEEEINLEELMAELAAMATDEEAKPAWMQNQERQWDGKMDQDKDITGTSEAVTEEEVDETINQAEADSAEPHGNLEEEGEVDEVIGLGTLALGSVLAALAGIIAIGKGLKDPDQADREALQLMRKPAASRTPEEQENLKDAIARAKKGTAVSKALDKTNIFAAGTVTKGMEKSGAGKTSSIGEAEELAEALATIETLQKDLNEVNLLNAKLLYVNKVFKANNLTESQKANVIAAFDKAETVKEVKLVFETVSESVISGSKKEVVKEAKGFASAAVGKSDKPEVITEANAAVLRMQKLAGIIK